MKNLLKKVLSVAAATALLMTSVISAAAEDLHEHKGVGTAIKPDADEKTYTITLNAPTEATAPSHLHYAAYQIFSGTVPEKGENGYPQKEVGGGTTEDNDAAYTEPGTNGRALPITDIKWGNAFGDPDGVDIDFESNVVKFVIALATAKNSTEYKYVFSDFNQFDSLVKVVGDKTYLANAYITGENPEAVNIDGDSTNFDRVNFDKLALAVAQILEENADDREFLQEFSDILGGYGKKDSPEENESAYHVPGYLKQYYVGSKSNNEYKITVPAGYYMIKDLSDIDEAAETNEAFSTRMLFVASNITQTVKSSVPTLEKHIIRDGDADNVYKTDVAGVGDDVKFQLQGTLPSNYDSYLGGYLYTFTDTLSKGLTYNENSAVVTVEGVYNQSTKKWEKDKKLTISTDSYKADSEHEHFKDTSKDAYSVFYDETNNILTVSFPCIKEIVITNEGTDYILGYDNDSETSSKIYVTYTAKVNTNAIVNPADTETDPVKLNGNLNTAQLKYSDNPQAYGDVETTSTDTSTVYTFGLEITKVDAAAFIKNDGSTTEAGVLLDGAKFVLIREKPDSTGTYQIAQFSTMPAGGTGSITTAYKSIDKWVDITLSSGKSLEATVRDEKSIYMTDDTYNVTSTDGKLYISGLNDDTEYTLIEIKTPDDKLYAFIDKIVFSLTAAKASDEYDGKIDSVTETTGFSDDDSLSMTKYVINETKVPDKTGVADFTVANFKYTDLPSTGGIGVYIYYIAGGCVVALALVLFALSKKKKTTK